MRIKIHKKMDIKLKDNFMNIIAYRMRHKGTRGTTEGRPSGRVVKSEVDRSSPWA
jgi:hypothetical protein